MRVHSITVQDVKGVRQRTVTFPDSGVVVVEGPNEVGKSTILEAFDKLLDPRLKATSTSKEVRKLQPVGQDVGPRVEAEFTVGGQRVRYAKRWLRQPATTLEVISPSPRQFSGEAAQSYVDRLIGGSLDRTLWDALRFAQSQDGTLAPLVDSTVLSSALDAAAGSQLHVEEGEQVLDLVAKEFALYYTRTGRPTGAYKLAMTDYTAAQGAVAEAHRRLQEAEELLERQARAREAATAAVEALGVARAEHEETRKAQEAVAEVVSAHERARALLAEAAEKSRAATRARQQRRQLVQNVEDLTRRTGQAAESLAADEAAAAELIERLASAEELAVAADEAVESAEAVCELARADVEHLADRARLDDLEGLAVRVAELVERLCAAQATLPELHVTARDLSRVTELEATEARLRAVHELASAQVRVESLGADVEVATAAGAEEPAPADTVPARGEQAYKLTEELVVTVPGSVRVVIVPEQGSQERAAELAAARRDLDRALVEHGVGSVAELAAAVAEQDAARESVRTLRHELEVALAGRPAALLTTAVSGHFPAELDEQITALREQVEGYGATRDGGVSPAADGDAPAADGVPMAADGVADLPADVATAEAVSRAATAALHHARSDRRQATDSLKELRQRAAALRANLDRAAGRLESDRTQLDALTTTLAQARAQAADEVLDGHVQERSAALAKAEIAAQQAQRSVEEADVDGISRRVLAAAARADLAQAEHDRCTATAHSLTGQVEMAASEGRREHYDLAVADLDHAERHLASLDKRARAARHLWRTLQSHRDGAHRAYVLPYTQALDTLGRAVYGDGFSVTVDDQLTLAARTLDGTTVPFEELSGGAKEQLGILARLAVARLVDPSQGVPVVIDDALGYSDPERLEQMGQVLGASADGSDVQVILLTCTPERYAAIPHTTTVRLTA